MISDVLMSHKTDDNQSLTSQDLVRILALAKHIDVQSQTYSPKEIKKKSPSSATTFAQKVDKDGYVHYAYAVLDPLSSSYSMFKYFFDAFIGGSSDSMHDFMLNPLVMGGIALESLLLVSFSFFAHHFDDGSDDKPAYQKWIIAAWPYARAVMKAMKNAYRGWRSTLAIFNILGVNGINPLIFPLGLAFGVIASVNRIFLQWMKKCRDDMIRNNNKLFILLKNRTSLSSYEANKYLGEIQRQSIAIRCLGYLSSAFGGFIDGLYLYAGAATLSVMAPPLLIAMASICAVYTLGCILTRIYEEYELQTKLLVTQTKCHLAILTKQIQSHYDLYLILLQEPEKNAEELKRLRAELITLLSKFEAKRCLLRQQTSRSYWSAFLIGIKYGLYVYGALSSLLYCVAGAFLVAGVAFPPILAIIGVTIGLAIVLGFIVNSFLTQRKYNAQQEKEMAEETAYPLLDLMKTHLEQFPDEPSLLTAAQLGRGLRDGLVATPPPLSPIQEFFEIFRSLFSGLGKGQKFFDFIENPLQQMGADGHYHDSPWMFILQAIDALFFGIVLALRAIARGFSRPAPSAKLEELPSLVTQDSQRPSAFIPASEDVSLAEVEVNTPEIRKEWFASSVSKSSSRHGFFNGANRLPRSGSEESINSIRAAFESYSG